MSYLVTILRTSGGRAQPISAEEVTSLAASRGDLTVEQSGAGRLEILVTRAGRGASVPLTYLDGEIWAVNPDRDALEVMLDLADQLGARVRGDELETYRTPDDSYVHPDDRQAIEESKLDVRRMRFRARLVSYTWFAGALCLAAVLGLAVDRCSRN